jgi:FkbM family methyltransferase
MSSFLKQVAARLPLRWQQEMKRHLFRWRIARHRYGADEPEVQLLGDLVNPGDWVLDVGANVGHYTLRLSELVGSQGRVLAFEPVPETFELLAAAACLAPFPNITLFNAAASSTTSLAGMSIPQGRTGLRNYYRARLGQGPPDVNALCLPIDGLELPVRVSLVKIDAEGHELSVLYGMTRLLERDRPVLLVEDSSQAIPAFLARFGYQMTREPGSVNCTYRVVRGPVDEPAPGRVEGSVPQEEGATPLR